MDQTGSGPSEVDLMTSIDDVVFVHCQVRINFALTIQNSVAWDSTIWVNDVYVQVLESELFLYNFTIQSSLINLMYCRAVIENSLLNHSSITIQKGTS